MKFLLLNLVLMAPFTPTLVFADHANARYTDCFQDHDKVNTCPLLNEETTLYVPAYLPACFKLASSNLVKLSQNKLLENLSKIDVLWFKIRNCCIGAYG